MPLPEKMTVGKLIKLLERCDPSLPVAVEVDRHVNIEGTIRIAKLESYKGPFLLIGDPMGWDLNKPNWYVSKVLDGGPELRTIYPENKTDAIT